MNEQQPGRPKSPWKRIGTKQLSRRPLILRLVPVEDAVLAVGAVGGRSQVDAHAQAPRRGFRPCLHSGGPTLNQDGLAGAAGPLGSADLEHGQFALQALDVGRQRIAGGALPPSGQCSGGPDEEARRENNGADREGKLAGEAVGGSAYGGIRGMSGLDQVALYVLDGAGEVGLSSTEGRVDLLAISVRRRGRVPGRAAR